MTSAHYRCLVGEVLVRGRASKLILNTPWLTEGANGLIANRLTFSRQTIQEKLDMSLAAGEPVVAGSSRY